MKTCCVRAALIVVALWLCNMIPVFSQSTSAKVDSIAAKPAAWFSITQIADGVWRIDDHGNDNMYLVAGKEKALLVDAGTGMGDLLACVNRLTSLPVIAMNTHGHTDHAGGDYQFSPIYAHLADSGMIRQSSSVVSHIQMAEAVPLRYPELDPLINKDFTNARAPQILPIQEGFVFDLGDRKLEVIETPGHTRGSVCLLDAKNKLLFTGDNDNSLVWLFLKESLPLELYVKSLQHLQKRSAEFTTILPGHGDPLNGDFIGDQIACGQQILSGECKGEPYKSFAGDAKVCQYNRASIAFNPENLHEVQK